MPPFAIYIKRLIPRKKKMLKKIVEDMTRSEVRSIINSRMEDYIKEKEFEKRVSEIASDAFERFFKLMYNRRNFWKGEIKNV